MDSYKKALEEIQKTLQETDNNYLAKESLLSIEIERRQKVCTSVYFLKVAYVLL